MSNAIVIYRKGNNAPKVTKGDVAEMRRIIKGKCRVQRDELVDLFVPARTGARSDFYRLAEVAPSVINDPWRRMEEHASDGWVVPVSCLGRKGEVSQSTANSILLWIKQNLSDVVDPADVSITLEER